MNSRPQVARQRRFYSTRTHAHLRPRAGDHYAQKLAHALALQIGLNSEDRILEVGAGFGRFTFDLLEWCGSMVALDLSARALSELEHTREERGISPERCSTLCADLTEPVPELPEAGFDAVVGFFLLHHLPDLKASIAVSAPLLKPGGHIAFIEPNRRNPLFLAQVAFCSDMTWRDEKACSCSTGAGWRAPIGRQGWWRSRPVASASSPQILNQFTPARRLEASLERLRGLAWIRPMLVLSARAAAEARSGT